MFFGFRQTPTSLGCLVREPIRASARTPEGQHNSIPREDDVQSASKPTGARRRRRAPLRFSALGLAFAVATGADARGQATTIGLIASMNASSEVPAPSGNVSGALGTFTGTATKSDTGAALQWQMTFSGLTSPATAAHIHVAARGQPGPVVVPLRGPCTSPASGTANVDAAVLAAIQTGGAYVNVHTDTEPGR